VTSQSITVLGRCFLDIRFTSAASWVEEVSGSKETEQVMGAQNYNFASTFFEKGGLTTNFAFFELQFSDKNKFF